MASVTKPGKAYEAWLAERSRLESELAEAKASHERAMFRVIGIEKALHALSRFEGDPVAWANGETIDDDLGGIRIPKADEGSVPFPVLKIYDKI